MRSDFQPYPEYKESGLQWLGKIPAHWDCLPHRAIFKEIKEQGHVEEPLLSVTISRGVIQQVDLLANSSKKDSSNLDKSKYKLVEPGDIVYNKMRAWQGAIGVSRHQGLVSPAYIVVRLRKADNPDYFRFLFRTPGFAKEAERWSYGITSDMWSLRPEHFKLIYSCIPSCSDQDSIVDFLRSFDVKVHRFIRNRQRHIEVLNEQKQAIINQAVTRGINPNVRFKPSGIEWLGDIPENWELALFGRFLKGIDQGWSPVAAEGDFTETQWAVLTLSCIRKGVFQANAIKPIANETSVPVQLEVFDGDLLISRSNTRQLVGDCCIVESPRPHTIISDLIYRLHIKENDLFPRFGLFWLLSKTARRQIETDSRGSSSTMVKLSHGHIKRWIIALPSIQTQIAIVDNVEKTLKPIHYAIDLSQREIDLIREYRTRLISDVVTGKLDVRHLSPDIGEELAEPVALDEDIDDEELAGGEEPDLDKEVTDADD
jgi:type I restriction enzyme S subunit